MDDRDDKLRHERIAKYASVRRENSQVLEALVHSSLVHTETSTHRTHASPSSSYRRIHISPSDVSLLPFSRRRQVVPESPVVTSC